MISRNLHNFGCVRLEFLKILGKYESEITWSGNRYLIDTKGDHVKGISKTTTENAVKSM